MSEIYPVPEDPEPLKLGDRVEVYPVPGGYVVMPASQTEEDRQAAEYFAEQLTKDTSWLKDEELIGDEETADAVCSCGARMPCLWASCKWRAR